jgi:hypothetical protein
MVFWPSLNTNPPRISHYLGGEVGDKVEKVVLVWTTTTTNDANVLRPVPVEAMKLSHHGES